MPGRDNIGIRGLTANIVRGQVELTEDNKEIIIQCAKIAFKGQCKGSLRDSITLIIHGFAVMFQSEQAYCLDEDSIERLLIATESDNIFEALAKSAKKQLNGNSKPKL